MNRPQLLVYPSCRPALFSYSFKAMGTLCSLHLSCAQREQADMYAASAIAEVERIEKKYSRYLPDSVVSHVNRQAHVGKAVTLDEETAELLNYAFVCYQKSDGLFDVTSGLLRRVWNFSSPVLPDDADIRRLLPFIGMHKLVWNAPRLSFLVSGMELDFGGIGKEYAVDRLASLLADDGLESGVIDLGGDFFALGPQANGQPWKIGLRDPNNADKIAAVVTLSRGGLATSGNYERCLRIDGKRYGHILNPKTGWPVQGLSSVTVAAPECMVAGSLTTIAVLKGDAGIEWLSNTGMPHRWIDESGQQGGLPPLCNDVG
ncbi:MAG: FAD:protein FMN transferase [Alphaproteobacteria bacterium]|nr:FAD:protein FMN transferase [Alphaproteobacteria bacterium]